MLTTTNYKLKKPEGTDPVDIQDLNDNADIIDKELEAKLNKTGDASNVITKYTEASTLSELQSGEALSTTFGKIKLAIKNVINIVKLMGTTSISAIGDGTVTGGLKAINSNLKWKMYSSLGQLGLDTNATITDIINALKGKEPAMVSIPMWRSDFPNLGFASSGQRHVIEIVFPVFGYISIHDHDISNGVSYFRGHYGENYSQWTSTNNIGAIQIKRIIEKSTNRVTLSPGKSETISVDISEYCFAKAPLVLINGSRWCTPIITSITKDTINLTLHGYQDTVYAFAVLTIMELIN